jgi:hypothetical protein
VHLELTINTMLCPVHMVASTVLLDTLICKKEETLLKNQLELLVNIMKSVSMHGYCSQFLLGET